MRTLIWWTIKATTKCMKSSTFASLWTWLTIWWMMKSCKCSLIRFPILRHSRKFLFCRRSDGVLVTNISKNLHKKSLKTKISSIYFPSRTKSFLYIHDKFHLSVSKMIQFWILINLSEFLYNDLYIVLIHFKFILYFILNFFWPNFNILKN